MLDAISTPNDKKKEKNISYFNYPWKSLPTIQLMSLNGSLPTVQTNVDSYDVKSIFP